MKNSVNNHRLQDNAARPPSRQFVDMTPLLDQPELLREQAKQHGYLFFRGLLLKERVMGLRCQMLEILQRRGLLDDSFKLIDGMADMGAIAQLHSELRTDVGVPQEVYLEIQKLEEFHAIAHDPALFRVFALLFGEQPFLHPRNICRMLLPHPELTPTPPHQDFIHIQGTPSTWTCWFPLGDCPHELGGLAVLESSHHLGVIDVTDHAGAGGLESILCGYNLEWATDDYFAGDVLILHSYMVHRGIPRQLSGRIRLSCDFRYQPASEVIDPTSLLPHGPYTWEQLYEGWTNDKVQYYWKARSLSFSEWDESIRWQKDKIC